MFIHTFFLYMGGVERVNKCDHPCEKLNSVNATKSVLWAKSGFLTRIILQAMYIEALLPS